MAKQTTKAKDAKGAARADLLFEIGTEELPYQFVRPALTALEDAARRLLQASRLSHATIRTLGTPRRLVLVVEELAGRQEAATTEAMGPPKAAAFDVAGVPTKAALGFAASQNVRVEDLEIRRTPRGEYVCAVKRDPGQTAQAILPDLLSELIRSLSFPKAMRWNAAGVRFARPIRWLTAIYGGRAVEVAYAGLTATNRTYGHRFLGGKTKTRYQGLAVKDFKHYVKVLERHGVIVDPETRRAMILSQLAESAKSVKGVLHHDDELLEQAVYTVEYPQALLGAFNPTYLSVPQEVLMTAMKEHQGFFSLMGTDGALLPNFISVTNMKLADMRVIREGNERVLAARLADAKFFFDEDRKIKLADRVERLTGVTFHQRLGTLYQKAQRMSDLAGYLAMALGHRELVDLSRRAARLSKADLVTGLVGEFPTLQGVMGGEYAKHDGESPEVSRAIREHYLPKAMESRLPDTRIGKIVSLADRLDSIAAFFHVGIVPTGSEDPLGLRRHALATVRLIVEGPLTVNLADVVAQAKSLVEAQGFRASGAADVLEFIGERLRYYVRTVDGVRDDIIDAVLNPVLQHGRERFDLLELRKRMLALHEIARSQDFDPLIVGFKRAHRIVEKEHWTREEVQTDLFQHAAEGELHKAWLQAKEIVPPAIGRGDEGRALAALVAMKPAIDAFFAGVMVNTDDPSRRANRLSLLTAVDRLFLAVADFSLISVQGS